MKIVIHSAIVFFVTVLAGILVYTEALATAQTTQEPGPAVSCTVVPSTATIGDRVRYEISAALPDGWSAGVSTRPAALGEWDVKDMTISTAPVRGSNMRISYTLVTFTTGTVVIPAQTIDLRDPAGSARTATAAPTPVTIQSVLPLAGKNQGLRDILPPITIPLTFTDYLPWIAGLLALGIAIWWFLRRRAALRALNAPPAPPIPPFEKAMAALEALSGSSLLAENKVKEYYSALGDIVRDFLGSVYRFDALEQTTAELLKALRALENDRGAMDAVRTLLESCDLVKFAKYRPDAAACAAELESARTIISRLRPAPPTSTL